MNDPAASCPVNSGRSTAWARSEGNLHGDQWTLKPGEVRDWGDVRPVEP